jgi:hypothetical protein
VTLREKADQFAVKLAKAFADTMREYPEADGFDFGPVMREAVAGGLEHARARVLAEPTTEPATMLAHIAFDLRAQAEELRRG